MSSRWLDEPAIRGRRCRGARSWPSRLGVRLPRLRLCVVPLGDREPQQLICIRERRDARHPPLGGSLVTHRLGHEALRPAWGALECGALPRFPFTVADAVSMTPSVSRRHGIGGAWEKPEAASSGWRLPRDMPPPCGGSVPPSCPPRVCTRGYYMPPPAEAPELPSRVPVPCPRVSSNV